MPSGNRPLFPIHPLAEPIRGSEVDSFAEHTLSTRLPDNARRLLQAYGWPSEIADQIKALADEMPYGKIRHLGDHAAPDAEEWANYVEPLQGQTWLELPWFIAETYFYRRILEATGYYLPGPGHGIDPYTSQKQRGLKTVLNDLESLNSKMARYKENLAPGPDVPVLMLAYLLRSSIWGNQADLSLWPSGEVEVPDAPDRESRSEYILIDNSSETSHYLLNLDSLSRVDIILDNSGVELAYDLYIADYLLTTQLASIVLFHTKSHPTFVSDATSDDVQQMVNFIKSDNNPVNQRLGTRLAKFLDTGMLVLRDNYYWTSPLSGWEMPAELYEELTHSNIIFSKGDANYRRWLGDRHWSYTEPAINVLGYFPAPLVALRVLKSNTMVGLSTRQHLAVEQKDPEWLYSGKWGIIQFIATRM